MASRLAVQVPMVRQEPQRLQGHWARRELKLHSAWMALRRRQGSKALPRAHPEPSV